MRYRSSGPAAPLYRPVRDPILAHSDNSGDDMTAGVVLARTIALPRLVLGGERYRIDRIAGTLHKTKDPLVAHARWDLLKFGIARKFNAS
jgi:hypothetical protein